MTTKFREPTIELPEWINTQFSADLLLVSDPGAMDIVVLDVERSETLLEALLDICPNAKALAHNFILERDKAEHMKGGGR